MMETKINWWQAHVMEKSKDDYDGWLKGKQGKREGRQKHRAMVLNGKGGGPSQHRWLQCKALLARGRVSAEQKATEDTKSIKSYLNTHQHKHLTLQRQNSKNQHLQKPLLKVT